MTVQSHAHTRRHSTCHRHPTTLVTGFCASCLRERLAGIEAAAATTSNKSPSRAGSELRRSKSCSGGPKSEGLTANHCGGGGEESQRRRSCDVRPRGGNNNSSLWTLFSLDDKRKGTPRRLGFDDLVLKEEKEDEIRVEEDTKTMKEFIDLEWTKKKSNGIAGAFWEKASGLSKKLTKWRRKAKTKKTKIGEDGSDDENENYGGVVLRRETQSEVGEYGFGRRSCDTDPGRFSFDEPRASWDGCLIGKAAAAARMAAVVEEGSSPGGTEQTNDYYSERRGGVGRRSFDYGNPISEDLRVLSSSNAKVSPATTELFYGAKLLITERDLDPVGDGGPVVEPDDAAEKKPRHRVWSIWGGGGGGNKPRLTVPPSVVGGTVSQKLIRSYSVSCRNQGGKLGMNGVESRGNCNGVSKSREEFFLQRNRSVRYSPSPSHVDSGLLRFYLTPLRSYSRRSSLSGKSRLKSSNSMMMAKNVL